jgi:hypothetical protein
MQIITIDNQQFIALPQVAKELKISSQRVHELIELRKIKTTKLNKRSLAIQLIDFEILKDTRIWGRPKSRKNK